MDDERPTPEEMLERLHAAAPDNGRGKLHIFFGAAPGVGKTYTMLEAARVKKREGADVVVGWVQTHGRPETDALLEGLEILPPQVIPYRHLKFQEFDLDAALARRPALIIVDELAHTNVHGSRHAKRWQDVEELLEQGVDVFTTLNVQHIESLNDVVVQITGVVVREKVPDSIFDAAEEVELVDLPPEELLQRLREGKVYVKEMAARAVENFFQVGNLIALRELALRRTAERVHAQMGSYRREHGVKRTWATAEGVVVAVSPAPQSGNLIRAAYRMSSRLRAPWGAVFVETPKFVNLSAAARQRINDHLKMAEELGAEIIVASGENVAEEVLAAARKRNATRILVGKSQRPRWRTLLRPSAVEGILRGSGNVDVIVTTGEEVKAKTRESSAPAAAPFPWREYLASLVAVGAATAVCRLMLPVFDLADQAMVYLLCVVLVSSRFGRGPSLFASVLSVAALDFFFVAPYFTFTVNDIGHIITFGVMLVVAFLISSLTLRIKQQAAWARERERRTSSLYAMARDFVALTDTQEIARHAAQHVRDYLGVEAKVILRPALETPAEAAADRRSFSINEPHERAVATWVMTHGREAGRSTETLSGAEGLYIPLRGTRGVLGVLAVETPALKRALAPAEKDQINAFAHQTALAIERAILAGAAAKEISGVG